MSEWSASNEAARVWEIFSGMYGVRLTRDFGESVPDVWRQAISGLQRYEIERGLRRLTTQGSGSPPTLPQFMRACKEVGDDNGSLRPAHTIITEQDLRDKYDRFADHLFFNFLMRCGGIPNDLLSGCIAIKKKIAADFRLIGSEETVEPKEMQQALHKQWNRLVAENTDAHRSQHV